jgi:hypothetical protein
MDIVGLENVVRKDSHIYYRREFKADAIIEIMDKHRNVPVEFVLEHKPTGGIEVSASINVDLEYPMVPVVNKLKLYIAELDKQRALP